MTRYLLKWPPIKVLPDGTQIQLEVDENGELREPVEMRRPGYFSFGSPVGRNSPNQREDVLRAQTLLGHAGHFDMERTEGPTGWYGKPLELGIRKFQKQNGLTVDGFMEPGGETVATLEKEFGDLFAPHKPPSLKLVDEHHERRARSEPGLLETDRGKGKPFGVTLEVTKDMKAPELSDAMMRRPGNDRLTLLSGGSEKDGGMQVASAANGTMGRRDPIIRSWPEGGPMVMGGGGRGAGGAVQNTGRALDGVAQQPDKDAVRHAADQASTRAALADGIAKVFDQPQEARWETANTKKSTNIMMQQCEEVLKNQIRPLGFDFQHKAGGSIEGKGEKEVPETAVKNGEIGKGGGGHNLPDLLYVDENNALVVGYNIATEAGPGKYVTREIGSFASLVTNMGEWVAKITGKKRDSESDDDFAARVHKICEDGFNEAIKDRIAKLDVAEGLQQPGPSDMPPSP